MPTTKTKIPVKVVKRSLFNKNHVHQLSSNVGTITPILIDEVIPNSTVRLKINLGASMPPLASDAYMKCDIAVEAFFIPLRLCYGGAEAWFCQREDAYMWDDDTVENRPALFPHVRIDLSDNQAAQQFGVKGLADYLGYSSSAYQDTFIDLNPCPFIAYHLVWQHYYRNPLVEKECFTKFAPGSVNPFVDYGLVKPYGLSMLPYVTLLDSDSQGGLLQSWYFSNNDVYGNPDFWTLADEKNLFSLRQRNFDFDYFTNAFPTPTLGDEQLVYVRDDEYTFTISSLRAANALADFANKNQLAGTRYADTLKARYGANLSDGIAQRPVCLGSVRYNVYNKSMVVGAANDDVSFPSRFNQLPYYSRQAGGVLGNAYASGSDLIIDNFTANEPGYILVNATLVPQVTYATAVDRLLTRYREAGSLMEMANAQFQGVGNQPIYEYELTGNMSQNNSAIFGYTDRYADWMTKHDRVSGLLRKNLSLGFMVAQRAFGPNEHPRITSSFLKIPSDYLDSVFALSSNASFYGYWLECAFDYNVIMPLQQYSIPSLIDPAQEHGDTVVIHRGGFRF